jgi:DNA-binding GntR family transcriptional regulator
MGGAIACQARHVSRREAPKDVAWVLRLPSGAPIRVVRCVWLCAGDPAAVSTAYLNEPAGDEDGEPGQEEDQPVPSLDSVLNTLPAAAVSVEMSSPQPSIARSLRLSSGQPVITVTARFDDAATGEPAGLTVVVLRPELFRVAIDTTEAPAGTLLASRSRPGSGWSAFVTALGVPAWTCARRTWDAGSRDAGRGS